MFQCNDLLFSLFLPPLYASLFFGSNVSIHLPSSQQQMALAASLGFPQGKLLSLGQFAVCRPPRAGPARGLCSDCGMGTGPSWPEVEVGGMGLDRDVGTRTPPEI